MKRILKIIGIVMGISIGLYVIGVVVTAVFTLSGIGNPITNFTAKRRIAEYVEENYADYEFEDIKVVYNFKWGGYGTHMQSVTSPDTSFYISYDDGEIYDSFDDYVTSGMNTYNRITAEFNDYVNALIDGAYPGEVELCLFDMYSNASDGKGMERIANCVPLDGNLDIAELADLGIQPSITVWFYTDEENITYDIIAERFTELKELMEQNGIYPAEYSVSLRLKEEHEDRFSVDISVYDFPMHYIGSDEFMSKLIEYDELGKQVTVK